MKNILSIIVFSLLLALTPQVYAETSVTIENNGDGASSEVHVENSVDNGDSSTTVCINGKCETTQGNVERQEGGAKVKVENIAQDKSSGQDASKSGEASISAQFTLEQMFTNFQNFLTEFFSQNK